MDKRCAASWRQCAKRWGTSIPLSARRCEDRFRRRTGLCPGEWPRDPRHGPRSERSIRRTRLPRRSDRERLRAARAGEPIRTASLRAPRRTSRRRPSASGRGRGTDRGGRGPACGRRRPCRKSAAGRPGPYPLSRSGPGIHARSTLTTGWQARAAVSRSRDRYHVSIQRTASASIVRPEDRRSAEPQEEIEALSCGQPDLVRRRPFPPEVLPADQVTIGEGRPGRGSLLRRSKPPLSSSPSRFPDQRCRGCCH